MTDPLRPLQVARQHVGLGEQGYEMVDAPYRRAAALRHLQSLLADRDGGGDIPFCEVEADSPDEGREHRVQVQGAAHLAR